MKTDTAPLTIRFDIDLLLSVFFFSMSNFSRMLLLFGIPRTIPYFVYIFVFLIFFLKHVKELRLIDYFYFVTVIPLVVVGLLKYSSYIASESNVYATIILFLPSYLFFRLCNKDKLEKGFKISISYSTLYLLVFYVLYVANSNTYNMNYAYWISVPMCALLFYYLKERNIINIILFGCCLISLILSGCRGALILSFLCVMYYYLFCDFGIKDKKRKSIRVVLAGVLLIVILINMNALIAFLSKYTDLSRSLNKLLSGDFFVSQNRDKLYAICKDLIQNRKLGYGVLASRELISGYPYPHSIFYELQLDFGMVVGSLLTTSFVVATGKLLVQNRKDSSAVYIAIIAFIGIGSLFVSSSLYQEYYVPAVIALAVKTYYDKKVVASEL